MKGHIFLNKQDGESILEHEICGICIQMGAETSLASYTWFSDLLCVCMRGEGGEGAACSHE